MRNFAKKFAIFFALCLTCVSFAAAAPKPKNIGKAYVSKTASVDSSTKTINFLQRFTSQMSDFDVGNAEYIYVKFDSTKGDNGKKAKSVYINESKVDGDFEFGKWQKIPTARNSDGSIFIEVSGVSLVYSLEIK